jgi:hypothetical protein
MLSNKLAFVALALACIGAAGAGGYLASRQNAVPTPASAHTVSPTQPAATTTDAASPQAAHPAPQPVQETEAVVSDSAPKTSPKNAGAKRAERTPESHQARAATPRHDQPPPLTSSWPSAPQGQAQPPVAPPPPATEQLPPVAPPAPAAEPQHAPEPPQHTVEELVVSPQTVIGLQTETRLSSETARVEDRVDARVTRDVRVGDRIAIPAGSHALGSVMQVERGGKFKERARLGIRFHTLVLADGTRVPIQTDTIYRDGEAPGNSSAAKVGGAAVGGAIIGAILGGAKGAAIGATAGAGGGTAAVMAGDRQAATLPAGTPMTIRILQPVTVTIDKN